MWNKVLEFWFSKLGTHRGQISDRKYVNLSFWPKLFFHATFQAFYFHMVLSYIVCRFAIRFKSYNFQNVLPTEVKFQTKKLSLWRYSSISDCLHQVVFFLCLNHFQFIHTFTCSSVAIFSMVKSIYSAIHYTGICKFYHLKTDVISKVQVSFEPMWKQAMVKSIYSAIHYICKFYHLKTDVI